MKVDYEIGIIGAGFAGLVAALRLKKSGRRSFVVFERAVEIGGTWRDNTYPGCACDVASPLYSLAQELNPSWSRLYSPQPEILAYMKEVVRKNELGDHIRCSTDITGAVFQKESGTWQLTDNAGNHYTVRMLISGTGPLNRPNIPPFKGLDSFRGCRFHTAAWDHSVDLTGKNIALIGTGASAIQVIPELAPLARQLTIFQRTPAWVTPRRDRPIGEEKRKKQHRFPWMIKLQREFIYWRNELIGFGFTGNNIINRIMQLVALSGLARQVKDPATRKKLTPDYKIGCKRILRSDDYYQSFNRPNVSLVTEPIERFTETGIVAGGSLYPFDAVIFATGFIAADIHLYIQIKGLGGKYLVDEWRATGAEAYLGTTVAGYPNFCLILGPNTGLGNNSVLHIMESQMNYIEGYVEALEKAGKGSYFNLQKKVQDAYNSGLQKKFSGTVWSSGCKSWYLNRAGKNTTLFPRLSVRFRRLTKKFDPSVYTVCRTEPKNLEAAVSI